VLDRQANFAPQYVAWQLTDMVQVELIDKLVVNAAFELSEFFSLGGISRASGGSEWLGRYGPRSDGIRLSLKLVWRSYTSRHDRHPEQSLVAWHPQRLANSRFLSSASAPC
jgi:hypothetical protein